MSAVLSMSPYITCRNATAALDFYRRAFDAVEVFRMTDPADGRIGHAEMRLGNDLLMISDEYPDFGALSPDSIGGSPVLLHLATADVEADVARAVEAGAMLLRPVTTQSFGERNAVFLDPFGHRWMLSQTVETLSPDEMQRRWTDSVGG